MIPVKIIHPRNCFFREHVMSVLLQHRQPLMSEQKTTDKGLSYAMYWMGVSGQVCLPMDNHRQSAPTQTYTFSVLSLLSKEVFYTSYTN